MPILELITAEAKYRNDMARDGHFAIDCACGGKDGKYSGSHYKNANEAVNRVAKRYQPLNTNRYEHTFYFNETLFLPSLRNGHTRLSLVIVCNDCEKEFPFTHQTYLELREKMMREYNRQIFKTRKKGRRRSK